MVFNQAILKPYNTFQTFPKPLKHDWLMIGQCLP